jgi:hypothetical protein
VASDECGGGQIEDQASIHLLIEIEVEVVEGSLRIAMSESMSRALSLAGF